jgi:hypothetical protein
MKKKLLTAVLGGTAVATLAFASASALTVDGGTLQAGAYSSLTCDSDGVKVNWGLETGDNTVQNVRISGIDAACAGAKIFVKTNLMSNGVSAVVPEGASQVSIPLPSPFPAPEDINAVRVWIQG